MISLRADTGSFTLKLDSTTTGTISLTHGESATSLATDAAAALNTALGGGSVAVTGASTVSGYVLTVTFTALTNETQLVATGTGLTPVNEVQQVTVVGAVSGTYMLSYNGVATDPIDYNNDNLATVIGTRGRLARSRSARRRAAIPTRARSPSTNRRWRARTSSR